MIDGVIQYFQNFTMLRACVLLGTITGLIVMVLQIKQHIALWYFNIISASMLAIDFFATEVYAYGFFQFYYIVVSAYGLYSWKHGRSDTNEDMPIQMMKSRHWVMAVSAVVLLSGVLTVVLQAAGSEIAIADAFITSMSAVATFLLTKKFFNYWYFWIVADTTYVTLVISQQQTELYPTVMLYVCYIISSIIGIFEWKKMYRKQEAEKERVEGNGDK